VLLTCFLIFLPGLCHSQTQDTLAPGPWPLAPNPQDSLTLAKVESRSSALYESDNWEALKLFGDSALAAGFDFFQLRRRLGYAYFITDEYKEAIPHLLAASHFDASDRFVFEQLQKCFTAESRQSDARLVGKKFSKADRKKYDIHAIEPLRLIAFEAGLKSSGVSPYIGNQHFGTIQTASWVGFRTVLYQGFRFSRQKLNPGHYNQVDYYFRPKYYLGKRFSLNPTYHLLTLKGTQPFSALDSLAPIAGNSKFSTNAHLFELGLSYQAKKWYTNAFASMTTYTNETQLPPTSTATSPRDSSFNFNVKQVGVFFSTSIWPAKRRSLKLRTSFFLHSLSGKNTPFFYQALGVNLLNVSYFELRYLKAGANFFSEFNGQEIYNNLDPLKSRWSLTSLIYIKNPKFYLNFHYSLERRQHQTHKYTVLGLSMGFQIPFE
jgi:hypothetical protein